MFSFLGRPVSIVRRELQSESLVAIEQLTGVVILTMESMLLVFSTSGMAPVASIVDN